MVSVSIQEILPEDQCAEHFRHFTKGVAEGVPDVQTYFYLEIYSSLSLGVLLATPPHAAPEMEDSSTVGWGLPGVRRDAGSLFSRPGSPVPMT